jgi:UDP-glucose 4-epimerase
VTDEVFNVASSQEISLKTVAETLLRVMDSPLRPVYESERTVNPVPRRLADTRRAKALLGFETSVSLDEGMRSFVEWWRRERLPAVA